MSELIDRLNGLIHSIRDEKGQKLNVTQVAKLIEINRSTLLGKFNRESLKVKELEKICAAIGYKVEFVKDDKK